MCISFDHVGSCAAQMERSSSRVFQPSPEHVANEKQVVFGLLKQHVPTSWIKAILADGCDEQKLFYERTHVADSCQCLLKELVQVNPYLKKTSIEGALLQWDDECEQKLQSNDEFNGHFICQNRRQSGWNNRISGQMFAQVFITCGI